MNGNPFGSSLGILLLLCGLFISACNPAGEEAGTIEYEELTSAYIEAWKGFYPSGAARLGLDEYLAFTEERAGDAVQAWIVYNEGVMAAIADAPPSLPIDLRIDLRLVGRQAEEELQLWKIDQAHTSSPGMYAGLFRAFSTFPEDPKGLAPDGWDDAITSRLQAIPSLAQAMTSQLATGDPSEVGRAIRSLDAATEGIRSLAVRFEAAESVAQPALDALARATDHLRDGIAVTDAEPEFPLGRDRYAEELAVYYDMEVSPEEVAERALGEIEEVRELIATTSRAYWEEAYPGEEAPADVSELVARVSADMEENRPSSEQEALEAFTRFAEEAEVFIKENGIATLPADRTLDIVLTPESAGPAQRIGFVDSPPPFDPEPMTVLSLPTIPDTFPEAEKDDFYRSFNNHFNKMIIIHELFPGHYMQLKIASGNPRQVRTFFPYEPYVEGWATLTEKLALDAGWDDFNKLTHLSHLRKRLENANRAYTSVQVHCFGWTEDEVANFSEERALLAPQFAKSLFGRLERGPMQMTSYFMGKDMFTDVLEAEMERLGGAFNVRDFSDVILNAGAVPMDMLPELLASGR